MWGNKHHFLHTDGPTQDTQTLLQMDGQTEVHLKLL